MKAPLITAAIAAIALVLPTSASAAALSDLLDIDTTSLEELLPGADINLLTNGSNPAAAAVSGGGSTAGSCGAPTFKAPTCGGGGGGFVPSFGFGVIPVTSITLDISLTININIDIDIDIDGDFGGPIASPSRCSCVCRGF